MLFLYIAAAVCVVVCAADAVMMALALQAFRKWRGSVLARFADMDAMIAALPDVMKQESKMRMNPALTFTSVEEALCAVYGLSAETAARLTGIRSMLEETAKADDGEREERSAQDRKNGVDITEDVMNMLRYSVEDAFGALRGNGGDGE